MKFKRMSEDMTEDEINTVFRRMLRLGKLPDYELHVNTNYFQHDIHFQKIAELFISRMFSYPLF